MKIKCELYIYLFSFLDLPVIGGCAGTRYGCCPNGETAALGPNNKGCNLGR